MKLPCVLLLIAVLLTGAYGQPLGKEPNVEEEATCGLTRAQIPLGLTTPQANRKVAGLSCPRGRLGFEMLEGLVWRYQLTEPYAKISGWLGSTPNQSHRLHLFPALAVAGAGHLAEADTQRFLQTLLEVRDSNEWKQVFAVLARLDSGRLDEPTFQQLRKRLSISQESPNEEYSQRIERLNLEDLLNDQQFRLLSARKIMLRTLALPRAQRLATTADLYAELDGGFSEILTPWAAARLVRETWASQPGEQVAHRPNPERIHEVAEALRGCLKRAGAQPDVDERLGIKLRLLRALRYIGGNVSEAERRFIKKNAGHHIDLLQ